MILDNLSNTALYTSLSPRFAAAFRFLNSAKFSDLKERKTPILGDEVFALRVEGNTQPESACLWEGHQRYADIHCLATGGEAIGYAPVSTLKVTQPLDGDDILYAGQGRAIPLRPGEFMVFFPSDGHMTGIADGVHAGFQKIVVKVLVA